MFGRRNIVMITAMTMITTTRRTMMKSVTILMEEDECYDFDGGGGSGLG